MWCSVLHLFILFEVEVMSKRYSMDSTVNRWKNHWNGEDIKPVISDWERVKNFAKMLSYWVER